MKTFFLFFVFILVNPYSMAQAVYMDTLRNSFSANASVGFQKDATPKAIGIGYTFNSTANLGINYLFSSLTYNNLDYSGSGFGGSASLTFISEARGNNIAVDVGLFFSDVEYTNNRRGKAIQSSSFGIGLFITERLTSKESLSSIFFQAGISIVPISEAQIYRGNYLEETIVTPLLIQFHFSPTIKLTDNKRTAIIVEPAITHEIEFQITSFSISLLTMF